MFSIVYYILCVVSVLCCVACKYWLVYKVSRGNQQVILLMTALLWHYSWSHTTIWSLLSGHWTLSNKHQTSTNAWQRFTNSYRDQVRPLGQLLLKHKLYVMCISRSRKRLSYWWTADRSTMTRMWTQLWNQWRQCSRRFLISISNHHPLSRGVQSLLRRTCFRQSTWLSPSFLQ